MKAYALAGAATIAALAIATTASANVGNLTCADGHPQASLTAWRVGAVLDYQFTVDGTPADSGSVTVATNPQTLTSAAVLTGEHDLSVSVSGFIASARVSCGSPPLSAAPQPILPEVTPSGSTPVVAVGPGTPLKKTTPVKKTTPLKKPKAKVTCAYLRRVGAGPLTYARFGWPYRCRVSIQARGAIVPAVTG